MSEDAACDALTVRFVTVVGAEEERCAESAWGETDDLHHHEPPGPRHFPLLQLRTFGRFADFSLCDLCRLENGNGVDSTQQARSASSAGKPHPSQRNLELVDKGSGVSHVDQDGPS